MTEVEQQTNIEPITPETALEAHNPIESLLGLGDVQGYVTYDDVMEAIPEAELHIEQLEDALAVLIERGIEISDAELVEPMDDDEEPRRRVTSAVSSPPDIDLTAIGTNMSRVTSFAFGIQGPGANGTLLLDDIRLLSSVLETPSAVLVHHWPLDADGTDLVGGLNGTVQGPAVVPGKHP